MDLKTVFHNNAVPRVIIAGTNSGCGKTTIVCAILKALKERGLKVRSFKCGPDYIDPMFHTGVIGVASANLDSFFFDDNTLKYLLAQNSCGMEISIIEGVMGYYDGMSLDFVKGSTCDVARIIGAPVILVVNARGAAMSVLAEIHGFLNFYELLSDDYRYGKICGVILNQCNPMTYGALKQEILKRFCGKIQVLGFMPVMKDCVLESRHLGLVTAEEVSDLKDKLQILAAQAEKNIELDGIIRLAKNAETFYYEDIPFPHFNEKVRIAVARDRAFCFYYEDSLNLLNKMGAELVSFSPVTDREIPGNVSGLYLGGGYPELYAKELSENQPMKKSVRLALENGIPCIAECGGFMYLTEKIGEWQQVGYIKGESFDAGRLNRFGYVTIVAEEDNMLCKKGESIAAHEFHYWDSDKTGNGFTARKISGKSWECVHASDHLYAGYPHFHFYANPAFAVSFYNACLKYKNAAFVGRA